MIIPKIIKTTSRIPLLLFSNRYTIISHLFRKKNQAQAQQKKNEQKKDEPKERVMQDEEYNFFERRKEIDTGFDFSKQRELYTAYLPQKLGEGGIEEVLYWSQSVTTPQQIRELVVAFNKVGGGAGLQGNAQLEHFKSSVAGSVYLVDSLGALQQYALFAMRFNLKDEQFWQKMEFKCLKYNINSEEQVGWLVDIAFVIGQFGGGEELFNFVQKILAERTLTAEQYIKLFMVFSSLKRGEKPWIEKLLKGIVDTIEQTDAEQLTGVLASLKEAKKVPDNLNQRVQHQVDRLLPTLTLPQLLNVTHFFGFDHDEESFWRRLEHRAEQLLAGKKIGARLLQELTIKAMLSYRFSTDFIRKYIIPSINTNTLEQLSPQTLSALSKGLYIYELQHETKEIEEEIGKLIIGKITQGINQITDSQLVKVVQDYNLTRHGSRELYIFLEEVIKIKFIRHYDPQMDRNTIELLISIYDNSGMCSRQMLDSLHNLILE